MTTKTLDITQLGVELAAMDNKPVDCNGANKPHASNDGPKMPTGDDTLSWALYYTALGWHIIPVNCYTLETGCTCGNDCGEKSRGKHPVETAWERTTYSTPSQARSMWRNGRYNIGLHLGKMGWLAVDIDPRNGGDETWAAFLDETRINTDTLTSISGSREGNHIIYRLPDDIDPTTLAGKLGAGIDIKRGNGMIVLDPSLHPSGNRYEWELSSGPDIYPEPPMIPRALLEALIEKGNASNGTMPEFTGETIDVTDLPTALASLNPKANTELITLIIEDVNESAKQMNTSRSEVDQKAISRLRTRGATPDLILAIFDKYPIGEKYREKCKKRQGDKYLATCIKNADAWLEKQEEKERKDLWTDFYAQQAETDQAETVPPDQDTTPEPSVTPDATPDLPDIAKMPDLPESAQLTPAMKKEAATACQWLDDFIDFMGKASPLTPKTFFTAAGLFVGSMAIARRLYIPVSVEDNWIYPNLYSFFVGHSTLPRKTTATKVVRGIIRQAKLAHLLHQPRQTPEAFISEMSTGRVSQHYDTWTPEQQEKYMEERPFAAQRSWLLEEASFLLSSFNRDYSSGLLPMVLDLYECQKEGTLSANTQTRGREEVQNAYLSVFGATTYSAIARHAMEPMHWENGLFARFALVASDGSGDWEFWPKSVEYPPWLIEKLQWVATVLLPEPAPAKIDDIEIGEGDNAKMVKVLVTDPLDTRPVKITPGAWNHWERYSKAVSWDMLKNKLDFVPPKYFANYGRFSTMLIKVATVLAAFDTDSFDDDQNQASRVTIDTRHVYRAQQIVETWRASLHKLMGEVAKAVATGEQESIYQAIAMSGNDWVTRRDLLRSLNKTWRIIEGDVLDLLESGRIEEKKHKPKRGRASMKYRVI